MKKYIVLRSFSTMNDDEKDNYLLINGEYIFAEVNYRDEFTLDIFSIKTRKCIGYIDIREVNKLIKEI